MVILSSAELASLAPATAAALSVLETRLQKVADKGYDINQAFSFSEIVHRSPRRYDISLPTGGQSAFSVHVNGLVGAVLGEWSSNKLRESMVVRDGIVTSYPGADKQPLHADGAEDGVFNAFIPLVPVTSQGTEFWLGTAVRTKPSIQCAWRSSADMGQKGIRPEGICKRPKHRAAKKRGALLSVRGLWHELARLCYSTIEFYIEADPMGARGMYRRHLGQSFIGFLPLATTTGRTRTIFLRSQLMTRSSK